MIESYVIISFILKTGNQSFFKDRVRMILIDSNSSLEVMIVDFSMTVLLEMNAPCI